MLTETVHAELNANQDDLLLIAKEYFTSGTEFLQHENFDNSLDCFSKANELFQKIGNNEEVIKCLIQIGSIQLHFGDLKTANEKLEYAIELNKTGMNRMLEADIYSNLGRTLLTKTDFEKSVEYLNKSLVIYKELKEEYKIHHTLSILGIALSRLGKNEDSFRYLEQSLSYYEKIKDHKKVAENLSYLGSHYLHISKYTLALECFEKALHYFKLNNSKEKYARTLQNIGVIYMVTNNLHKALMTVNECKEIFSLLKMERDIASVNGSLGSIYRSLGRFDDSLTHYFKALELHKKLEIQSSLASDYANIGIVYRYLKDYTTAVDYLQKAISICYETDNKLEIGMYIGNLGITYTLMEQYPLAQKQIQLAITCFEKYDCTLEIAQFTANLGVIYRKLHRFDDALDCYTTTIEIFKKLQRTDEIAGMLKEIAKIYSEKQFEKYNPETAESYFKESIELLMNNDTLMYLNMVYIEISQFYEQEGRYADALEYHKKYLQLYEEIQNEEVKKQADWYQWEHKLQLMQKDNEIEQIRHSSEKLQLEKDIELKTAKLDSAINELVLKNKILTKIQQDIQLITPHTKTQGLAVIEKLSDFIERNIAPVENESDFTKFIKETKEKLQSINPDFTSMELKVCALLILNLSTSNICSYLHLSKRTIETHRLNIRKKLLIPKNHDLNAFLHQLLN